MLAARHVRAAQRASDALRAHVTGLDFRAARADLLEVRAQARSARDRTHDPLWAAAARLPLVGRPAAVIRGLSEAGAQMAEQALPAALQAAEQLSPSRIRPAPGRIDLAAVQAAQAPATAALDSLRSTLGAVTELSHRTWIGPLDRAHRALERSLRSAITELDDVRIATEVVPPLLGAEGPRTYFVGFQNNAEARGTGGLPGSFAIIHARAGRLTLAQVGSEGDIPLVDKGVDVDFGPDFDRRYRDFGSRRIFVNSNITAHFPYAARIWQAMWKAKTGVNVDGVMAIDPVAQSYLLRSTGPVRVTGLKRPLTAADFADYVMREIYADYPDVPTRKKVLARIAAASFDAVLNAGSGSSRGLVDGLRRAADERRLLIWSAHPREEALLEPTEVSGVVPQRPGPYAAVVLNNAAGSKLDYYIRTDLRYAAAGPGDGCHAARRATVVVITVHNSAPAHGLPKYVTIRADDATTPHVPGAERLLVSLYAAVGAELTGVTVDGRPSGATVARERSHPIYTVDVDIPPGATQVITVSLDEPVVRGAAPVLLGPPTVRRGLLDLQLRRC